MIVYKVLTQAHVNGTQTLVSATARYKGDNLDRWSLIYKPNETTFPRVGKLFAFESMERAKDFVMLDCERQIWKASTTHATYAKFVACGTSDIEFFWEHPDSDQYAMVPAPEGTLVCDDITILERIIL